MNNGEIIKLIIENCIQCEDLNQNMEPENQGLYDYKHYIDVESTNHQCYGCKEDNEHLSLIIEDREIVCQNCGWDYQDPFTVFHELQLTNGDN